ncbi:hypothetical protein [Luteitalea pratensis]|uniref:hypothetical protein n=1 Tax=Luteitalea pratensis TaxID=1855912 RepID=UPI0012FF5BB0|nr:hypothetical protein [Luteitalea pratensis]
MSKPVLAVGLLALMVGAWYWALLPHTQLVVARRLALPVATARSGPDVPAVRLADLAVEAAQRPMPDDGRNPFANGVSTSRGASAGADRGEAAAATPIVAPGAPVPAWPRLELIGVAEARDGSGLVRTAIVSGPHGVHHARAGEVLEQVYRVERIGGDGVDVRLLPEDRMLRLALRP